MTKKISTSKKIQVWDKTKGRCWYCGKKFNRRKGIFFEVDHLIPKAKNGSDDITNLVPACSICNHIKSDLSVEEFRIVAWNKKIVFPDASFYFDRENLRPEVYRETEDFLPEQWYRELVL